MREPSERQVAGELFTTGGRLFVGRYPLSSALPIPLGLRGGDLLTWAFCGLGRTGAEPTTLMVFTADGPPETLTVATHFHPLAVAFPSPRPVAALDAAAWAALCPAVLGALAPATLDPLAALLPHLGPALSALAEGSDDPAGSVPALILTGETEASLTGTVVPDYLLLRTGTPWRCHPVLRARLTFGAEPRTLLDLAQARGDPPHGRIDAALLVRSGEIVFARVAP